MTETIQSWRAPAAGERHDIVAEAVANVGHFTFHVEIMDRFKVPSDFRLYDFILADYLNAVGLPLIDPLALQWRIKQVFIKDFPAFRGSFDLNVFNAHRYVEVYTHELNPHDFFESMHEAAESRRGIHVDIDDLLQFLGADMESEVSCQC